MWMLSGRVCCSSSIPRVDEPREYGLPPGPYHFPASKELPLLAQLTFLVGPSAQATDQSTERQGGHCGMEWSALALELSGWAES